MSDNSSDACLSKRQWKWQQYLSQRDNTLSSVFVCGDGEHSGSLGVQDAVFDLCIDSDVLIIGFDLPHWLPHLCRLWDKHLVILCRHTQKPAWWFVRLAVWYFEAYLSWCLFPKCASDQATLSYSRSISISLSCPINNHIPKPPDGKSWTQQSATSWSTFPTAMVPEVFWGFQKLWFALIHGNSNFCDWWILLFKELWLLQKHIILCHCLIMELVVCLKRFIHYP